ncbi:MAG: hypothetical protein HY675_02045 [Chloroflexi bacterium]|nr:hypothetical protein [Chloroflexota bacterium]
MSNVDRLIVLVSVVTGGLALSLMLDAPLIWLLAAALLATVCIGTDHIIHSHWRVHLRRKRYTFTLWILPALLVLGAFLFLRLPLFSTGVAVVGGLLVTAILLAMVITCEYHTIDLEDSWYNLARFCLNLLAYLTAFSLYTAIYSTKVRSVYSATAILIISALFSLELLRGTERSVPRTWIYSLTTGVIMGEITWALNYWVISGLAGGLFLLLALYVITGVVQNHLLSRLSTRLVAEYALVAIVGLAVASSSGYWLQTT